MILMKMVGTRTKSGWSIRVMNLTRIAVHTLIKKIKETGRQSDVKEAADPLPQQQKKTRRFLSLQEDQPDTHHSKRQISPRTSINKS